MEPFKGSCEIPEVKKEVVTVGLNRDGHKKVASVMLTSGAVEKPAPFKTGPQLVPFELDP